MRMRLPECSDARFARGVAPHGSASLPRGGELIGTASLLPPNLSFGSGQNILWIECSILGGMSLGDQLGIPLLPLARNTRSSLINVGPTRLHPTIFGATSYTPL